MSFHKSGDEWWWEVHSFWSEQTGGTKTFYRIKHDNVYWYYVVYLEVYFRHGSREVSYTGRRIDDRPNLNAAKRSAKEHAARMGLLR